ncbi:MAG: LysM peptidoglycan-binding domain-containing protein [Chlamydiota bacterium]|nr:LysM peptidoglycan-binding domain-containing protein [Chlamydiota bacterium]
MKARFFALICSSLLISVSTLQAATRFSADQERSLIRKMYDHVEMMRHEMGNHEAELRVFEDKIRNMEDAIEDLQQQFNDTITSHQKLISGSNDLMESKVSSQESKMKNFVGDLKTLQTHANKSSTVLEGYQSQIAKLEKIVESRNKDLDNLKAAVKSLMTALGNADDPIDDYRLYEVQYGDSLGLIAQKKRVTVREIKDFNGLKNDVIIVGQKLKIPKR